MSAERPLAIVTGAKRGIGLAIATALARAGHDLLIADLGSEAEAAHALANVAGEGANVAFVPFDLSDQSSHEAVLDAIRARSTPISCLINNAGRGAVKRGDLLDLTVESFDAVLDTNLRGTVFFTQAIVREMLANRAPGPRTIVTIGSVSATLSSPERLEYCMSKAALASFSKGLALRLADEAIAVFEVRPGIIRTGMTAGVADRYDTLIADGLVPMRRWGEPEDIGTIVADLASGRFAFATGSVINADGGLSIGRL
ncbi:3-ketoacyl-ACP reductase [Pelagibacterium montanilacus]|uniref:3-ketoacyl-ACP reductase n=1 Tax=Pelagibacterium montanilacus TaxID=2185280 RepID=UPI000F8C72FB|nr:3-ketoacyl-ACP reductase [Pelagibacterium montanilacus]